jgi:hypothetical protein
MVIILDMLRSMFLKIKPEFMFGINGEVKLSTKELSVLVVVEQME